MGNQQSLLEVDQEVLIMLEPVSQRDWPMQLEKDT